AASPPELAFLVACAPKCSGPSPPGVVSPCPEGDSNKSSIARSRSSTAQKLVQLIDSQPMALGKYLQRLAPPELTIFGQFTKFFAQLVSAWSRHGRAEARLLGRNQERELPHRIGKVLQ